MISILSIDGGGIRGIIPATYLMEVERRLGQPICRLFDLIAGTSTGGILAATLALPDRHGQPKYTAEQVRAAYLENGPAIFQRSRLRRLRTLGGLTRPKYSPRNLDMMLERYLGNKRLHSTLTEILVTAYDMASATPWFFKTGFAEKHRNAADDPLLTQVVRATTAAPTYFPPLPLGRHCLVDGGVFAANPGLCAYAQARKTYPEEKDFFIVSLGTGLLAHDRPCSKIDNWGIIDWAVPISDIMLNAASATVNYQLQALVGRENYARFQVQLPPEAAAMDDAGEENMRRLVALAELGIRQQKASLTRVCDVLARQRPAMNTA